MDGSGTATEARGRDDTGEEGQLKHDPHRMKALLFILSVAALVMGAIAVIEELLA